MTTVMATLPLDYGSGDDDEDKKNEDVAVKTEAPAVPAPKFDFSAMKQKMAINLAPEVKKADFVLDLQAPYDKELHYNPKFVSMWGTISGPELPHLQGRLNALPKNIATGHVEEYTMEKYAFDDEYNRHNSNRNPASYIQKNTLIVNDSAPKGKKRAIPREKRDPGSMEYQGPWVDRDREEKNEEEPLEEPAPEPEPEKTEEEKEEEERKKKQKVEKSAFGTSSIFHGKELKDYLGRSYIDPPSDLKPAVNEAFVPKRKIHTYQGHTRGIAVARFFPDYGHLILSAGLDNTIRIWDVYNDRKCMRTVLGHGRAVKDVAWTPDGKHFLSSSYDKTVKYWDSETGECLGSFSNNMLPYCVKFYPNNPNEFIVGCNDKKIVQWDIRANQIVQEYDQHLGAVNTINFIDENRRFVSSSDDKTIRIWEYGIPVVIKYISEPHMHSMPAITVYPTGEYFLGQSLDNQILVYSAIDRFKLNKKKRFAGHVVAGYACQIGVSPDGSYIVSGDSGGRLWFWDWNRGKIIKTLSAHQGVCIGCEWHPIESSRMITCGWDGALHLWD